MQLCTARMERFLVKSGGMYCGDLRRAELNSRRVRYNTIAVASSGVEACAYTIWVNRATSIASEAREASYIQSARMCLQCTDRD